MPIQVLGLNIYEPATVLTNIALAMFCFAWFIKLKKQSRRFWPYFFLFISIATILGAVGHGLYEHNDNPALLISRIFAMNAFIFAGLDMSKRYESRTRSFLVAFVSIGVFTFSFLWILFKNDFSVVKLNGIIILLGIVGGTTAYGYFVNKQAKDALILGGVLINALAAVMHSLKISFNVWFNHNDIGHILMIFGLYLIFKGIDEKNSEPKPSIA